MRLQRMIEAILKYQQLYGFHQMTRAGRLVQRFLNNITVPCVAFEGASIVLLSTGQELSVYPACSGFAAALAITLGELEAWLRVVLADYPNAGMADRKPCVPSGQEE